MVNSEWGFRRRGSRRLSDSHSGDRVERLRAHLLIFLAMGLMLFMAELLLWAKGYISTTVLVLALCGTPFLLYGISALLLTMLQHTGAGLARVLFATGGEAHSREYSEQQALVATGRIDEAIDSYHAHLVAFPADVEARLRLAALYGGAAKQPEAAERHLLEVRNLSLTPRQELVVGNTLIDLYRSTGQRHLLKAELARFARLNHGTDVAEHARRHLRQLVEEDHRVT